MTRLRTYYRLAKPGIIYGNDLSAVAGFLLASSLARHFDLVRFVALLVGMSLVIGCGCVINNYIDRGIDARMARTKKRALVTAAIPVRAAIIYAAALGTTGFAVLLLFTNVLTALLGLIGLFFYLVPYSIFKRRAPFGTVVGSVSGAVPIAAGYTAMRGEFDGAAAILFLIMVCWQMPHFYGIAMYRFKDYRAAGIPVLPVKKGMTTTKYYILAYTAAFTAAAAGLTLFGYTGYTYMVVMVSLGLTWLYRGIRGFSAQDDQAWGRQMFLFSLIVLLVFSTTVAVGALLP